jgi:hypothetical protein
LQKAAGQNEPRALCLLSEMYLDGRYVPKNLQTAFEWLEKSAAQGFAEAQSILEKMCLDGEGVPQDERRAMELFRKAAENSVPGAQYHLGLMYAHGACIAKDDVKAWAWISAAATLGYEAATAWLFEMEAIIPETTRVDAQNLADKLFASLDPSSTV